MKILLTTLNSKFIHSSLSIRYLKSYCENISPNLMVKEYTINQNTDFITGEIFKQDCDVVAFSCYIWNIENTLEIAERLKVVKPDIKIIFGGPEVSFDGVDILKQYSFIDFIIFGEGEQTFKELLIKLDNGDSDYIGVKGLIYRYHDSIIQNDDRPVTSNLDDIPSPFEGNLDEYKNRIVYYESSRGCPFNCKFCLSSTIKGVRFFSIDRVKRDLKLLIKAGVKQVKFVDRTFNAKKEYALEVMQHIIKEMKNNKRIINFHFEVTAHLLDKEILEFLKDVPEGLFQFEIGVQSTNPETIKSIDRNTDIERLREVVQIIRGYGNIHQHLDLIAGLPYEGFKTFKKSFDDVYNMEPDKLQLGFLKLLKGSDLRIKMDRYGFKFLNKPPYEVLENDYISYDEMLKLKLIEDLVEKYGNESNFRNSIRFIIKNNYNGPFDFYEDFSIYWESNEYHTRAHSNNSLYKIIYDFYVSKISDNIEIFKEILKFDFIYNNKNPNLPEYLLETDRIDMKKKKHSFLKDEKNIIKYLPAFKGKTAKQIIKEVYFHKFKFNILEYIYEDYGIGNILEEETIVLFAYDVNKAINKCIPIVVTNDFLNSEE